MTQHARYGRGSTLPTGHRYPSEAVMAEEIRALPIEAMTFIHMCEVNRPSYDQFVEAVKSFRKYSHECKTKRPVDGQKTQVLDRILSFYGRILRLDAMLWDIVMDHDAPPPDDRKVADLVTYIHEHQEHDGEDAKDALVSAKRKLQAILHTEALGCMFEEKFEAMCDEAILHRTRKTAEKKKRQRMARRSENATRRLELLVNDDLPPLLQSVDLGPKLWIMKMMMQRSSAGERARPGLR